jgi:hypothetical protein
MVSQQQPAASAARPKKKGAKYWMLDIGSFSSKKMRAAPRFCVRALVCHLYTTFPLDFFRDAKWVVLLPQPLRAGVRERHAARGAGSESGERRHGFGLPLPFLQLESAW